MLDLFVTPLGGESPLVLGYNWLKEVNPPIDWSKRTVDLIQTAQEQNKQNSSPHPFYQSRKSITCQALTISLIRAAVFGRACRQKGIVSFWLTTADLELAREYSSTLIGDNPDLSQILKDYHEFSDIFSKNRTKQLPSHHEYDLSIQIEEGTKPLLGLIYSMSALELKMLWEFIEENLKSCHDLAKQLSHFLFSFSIFFSFT